MTIDLDKKTTQARFAQLVGVTQAVVSGLIARGVLVAGDSVSNWLLAYCTNLRDAAAGRMPEEGAEGLDLVEEKARLASAQADKVEMENAVTRNELASVSELEAVLAHAGSKVTAVFDAIPSIMKRRLPNLTDADIGILRGELARARNAVAALTLDDLETDGEEGE